MFISNDSKLPVSETTHCDKALNFDLSQTWVHGIRLFGDKDGKNNSTVDLGLGEPE